MVFLDVYHNRISSVRCGLLPAMRIFGVQDNQIEELDVTGIPGRLRNVSDSVWTVMTSLDSRILKKRNIQTEMQSIINEITGTADKIKAVSEMIADSASRYQSVDNSIRQSLSNINSRIKPISVNNIYLKGINAPSVSRNAQVQSKGADGVDRTTVSSGKNEALFNGGAHALGGGGGGSRGEITSSGNVQTSGGAHAFGGGGGGTRGEFTPFTSGLDISEAMPDKDETEEKEDVIGEFAKNLGFQSKYMKTVSKILKKTEMTNIGSGAGVASSIVSLLGSIITLNNDMKTGSDDVRSDAFGVAKGIFSTAKSVGNVWTAGADKKIERDIEIGGFFFSEDTAKTNRIRSATGYLSLIGDIIGLTDDIWNTVDTFEDGQSENWEKVKSVSDLVSSATDVVCGGADIAFGKKELDLVLDEETGKRVLTYGVGERAQKILDGFDTAKTVIRTAASGVSAGAEAYGRYMEDGTVTDIEWYGVIGNAGLSAALSLLDDVTFGIPGLLGINNDDGELYDTLLANATERTTTAYTASARESMEALGDIAISDSSAWYEKVNAEIAIGILAVDCCVVETVSGVVSGITQALLDIFP